MSNQTSQCIRFNSNPQTTAGTDRNPITTCRNIKYKPTSVCVSKRGDYTAPIQFQIEDPGNFQPKPKKRARKPYAEHVFILKQSTKISPPNIKFLSNWAQLLKTWRSSSMASIDIQYFIAMLGLSLNSADPRDRIFIAQCLQNHQKLSTKKKSESCISRKDLGHDNNILPLLEQATEAYFSYINPFNPFFTRSNFYNRPRNEFLRLCVWRTGLQFLPSSGLLADLSDNINQQILSRISPSALQFNLNTLQGLLILCFGLYDFSLNKYRVIMLHYASLLVNYLGLNRLSPGPLNQERLITFFTFAYNKASATRISKAAWYNIFPDFPLQTSAWSPRIYCSVGELYKNHPNNHHINSSTTEPFFAALDANMVTLSLSTYYFARMKLDNKPVKSSKSNLHQVLTWGTCELQKSKVLQLSNHKFVPLASCPQYYSNSMLVNYPESNRVLAQLQLVLHSRYHYASLSKSEPRHIFRLIDLLKLISFGASLFSRLTMLLEATKHLLMLPMDSKVEHYLQAVRGCLKNMDLKERNQHYARRYLLLYDALTSRTTSPRPN